jgi:hypothetical protein
MFSTMHINTKSDLIDRLGDGSVLRAADVLNITRQTLWSWPETLTQRQGDEATGAAFRIGALHAAAGQKQCNTTD